MIGREAIHEQVVDERAGRRHQAGVLRLTDGEPAGVVRRNALHGRQRVLAGDLDLAHVADVEDPGAGADGGVLVGQAAVFDRHFKAAEWNQSCSKAFVHCVEWGSFVRRQEALRSLGCLRHRCNNVK